LVQNVRIRLLTLLVQNVRIRLLTLFDTRSYMEIKLVVYFLRQDKPPSNMAHGWSLFFVEINRLATWPMGVHGCDSEEKSIQADLL